ncbi:MAG: rRNA maturation RNase YbeY [Rickettsiales bacterium]|nr:rRNA maturation RNase YbeY [Pseudomonadota bacterium]MDA0966335.1 rRNA maturation RNase YbeY [Pseudomonadota bacterium]MDG4543967.1 rRNA maturation RNase YbeY [Rickettsiales bacterium]MDG4545461.1 rRNA maturation RNase YbeY [Rickettsiales bacterium]MDG4547910.1 rRNA maturation RNase YbeY [Rickettsiales bacterium]
MQLYIEINCDSELWNGFLRNAEDIINDAALKIFAELGLSSILQSAEISVLLTDNESIRILNNDYRHKDKPTNILSFPAEILSAGDYTEVEKNLMLGDLAFGYEVIDDEAKEQKIIFHDHFTHLAVHGILHLLGYDHIEDDAAEIMEGIEIKILQQMGVADPYK